MSPFILDGRLTKPPSVRRPCRPALRGDETGEFWLEFPSSPSDDTVDPANSPRSVLTEVLMVLGVAMLLVLAVSILMPGAAV